MTSGLPPRLSGAPPAISARATPGGRVARRWAAALAVPLLCAAGAAHAVPGSDLVVNMTQVPASGQGPAGGAFQYEVTVAHNTGGAASGVVLKNLLPLDSIFKSVTSANGVTCSPPLADTVITLANQEVLCQVGNMVVNGSKKITFTVVLPTVGSGWSNQATVAHDASDPNSSNDSSSRAFTVYNAADMRLAVTATPDGSPGNALTPGQPFEYRVDVNNVGPGGIPAGGHTTVRFDVPVGVSVNSAGTNGWSCTPSTYPLTSPGGGAANTTVTCTRAGAVASGASVPQLVVKAAANATNAITASFNVKGYLNGSDEMPDGQPDNNTRTATVSPAGTGADLSLTKTIVGATTVGVGDNVTFLLRPRFNGGILAAGNTITVTDTLGTGLSYVSAEGNPTAADWSCGAVAQVITCTRTLPAAVANHSNLPDIHVVAQVTQQGTLNNMATISPASNTPDPDTSNDTGQASVTGSTTSDLEVWKSSSTYQNGVNQAVEVGTEFNFYIGVTNHGPLAVPTPMPGTHPTITVTDTIPPGVTVLGLTAGTSTDWSCLPTFPVNGLVGSATLVCSYAQGLANGASTPNIALRAVRTSEGIVTNTACVRFVNGGSRTDPTTPPDAWNNCDGVGVGARNPGDPVVDGADLTVTKGIKGGGPVFVGDTLTYTIDVHNVGQALAKKVQMRDVLADLYSAASPATSHGLQGVVAPPGTVCRLGGSALVLGTTRHVTGGALVCDLNDIPSGETRSIEVTVRPMADKTSSRTNTAWAYAQETLDPKIGNNEGKITSTVTARVDLRADKTANPTTAAAGEPILYTVAAINDGPSSAQNVWLKDTLPSNVELVGSPAPSNGGTCTVAAGVIDCKWDAVGTNDYLAKDGRYEVIYTLRSINNQPFTARTLNNTVEVGTATDEPNKANNQTTASVTLTAPALDVLVTMNDSPDVFDLGTETTYTIRVTNSGPSYGTNVTMVDTFPSTNETGSPSSATFSYEGSLTLDDPSKGTCTGPAVGATSGSVQCNFPLMAPNETRIITFKMKAQSLPAGAASGTIFHKAVVSVTETENRSGVDVVKNNTTHEGTTTRRAGPAPGSEIDLGIVKSTDAAAVAPGAEFDYSLMVTNHSPGRNVTQTHGAQVLDTLPAGLSLVSAPGCAYNSGTRQVSCAVSSLAGGAAVTFTLRVRVDSPYTGPASVSNTACVDMPGDPVGSNNCSTAPKTVTAPPPTSIPTLSEWSLIALSMLLAAFALRRMPQRASRRM